MREFAPATRRPTPAAPRKVSESTTADRDIAARTVHRRALRENMIRRSSPLVVGAADDRAELDADRIADAITAKLNAGDVHRTVAHGTPVPDSIGVDGGPVDEATAAEIHQVRGRGRRLQRSVASTFGEALGSDLSGVNIHTDSRADRLSRTMSATAFTIGSDVFFSKGAYRPDDAGGQHLLAHELAHVAQQRSGLRRSIIRRAIGFEFETSIVVKKQVSGAKVPLAKMEKLKEYSEGFNMEADENSQVGSTIEFVVEHVEEDDRKGLVKAMTKLEKVATELTKKKFPTGGDLLTLAADPPERLDKTTSIPRKDVWYVPQGKNVVANPQVTGGIAMDKVATMLGEIGSGEKAPEDKAAAQSLEKMSPDAPGALAASVQNVAGSEELKGLVAMLVGYLKFGSAQAGAMLNYAKLISNSTLIRTDFGTWFNRIPDNERKAFLEDRRGQGFVDMVLNTAGMAGTGATAVYERGVRKSYDKKSPDYNTPINDPKLLVSRQAWLLSITRGGDALSAYWEPALKPTLEGLGRLGPKMDQVGDEVGTDAQGSGVIMEFRNMEKDVVYTEWKPMALRIFDYIVRLNARKNDEDT